jgi:hypothetical protein
MFKIYQQTQAQITLSLTIAIDHQNIQYLLLVAFEMLVFCGVVVYMGIFYKKEN